MSLLEKEKEEKKEKNSRKMYRLQKQQPEEQAQLSTEMMMNMMSAMLDDKNKASFIEKYLSNEYYLRMMGSGSSSSSGLDDTNDLDSIRLKLINQLSPIGTNKKNEKFRTHHLSMINDHRTFPLSSWKI